MFTRKDHISFIAAASLVALAYFLMACDPVENGFGYMTLWLAPPILLAGFILPVFGINNVANSTSRLFGRGGVTHSFGLVCFFIAFAVYFITLEPTASLWDCSEFIASAYKLQVPHTPGTPLSLLVGRIFSMACLGDVSQIAVTINLMSGFFSALTVALVYYLILFLCKHLGGPKHELPTSIRILAASGGSLCLAFSDTFWFSAVEAETYGIASFFLVLIVWLILTGKALEGPLRSRRLVLIFYVAGLAYCIHPMCLLALPILPFTWYANAVKVTFWSTIFSIMAGIILVLIINRFVAVGLFELAFSLDLFLVNRLHMPFYSGVIALLISIPFLFVFVVRRYPAFRAYAWSIIFLFAGFSPYLILFIRSNHNPPIDEANPENLPLIKAYMNRESYPSSPLVFGPYFDAEVKDVTVKKQVYYKSTRAYEIAGTLPAYLYNSRQTLLPRLYSNDPVHIEAYREWIGLKPEEKPKFSHNLNFMFTFQLGHMYLRYLMWNFAGREGDAQNSGWLRPWDRLNASQFEEARNQYWMIPLVLGLTGAFYHYRRDKKSFTSVALFFLMTGLMLALYLNSPSIEPRERDYIYVGSYIAFCIWIGMGFAFLGSYLSRLGGGTFVTAVFATVVPLWMFYQNFGDHDRSGRTFQIDNARNVLRSCAPNSILFTGGDNDTFPLWYLQEVEGFRTDVRVMVLSYMNTDWYINQLRKAYYDSGAFALALGEKDYRQHGPNDVLYVQESIKAAIDIRQYLDLLKEGHPALRRESRNGEPYHILPSRYLKVSVPNESQVERKENSPASGGMVLSVEGNYLSKNVLAILDLIISNQWTRPIHFNFSSMNTLGVDISDYLIHEGPVYRLTPEKNTGANIRVDKELSFRNLVEVADYANLRDSTIYLSYEDHFARMLVPIRQSFNALAVAYLDEGNVSMVEKVLEAARQELYHPHLRPSYTNLQAAEILQIIGKNDLADLLTIQAFDYYYDRVAADLADHREPDRLETYLLKESAALLEKTGKTGYMTRLAGMDLSDVP